MVSLLPQQTLKCKLGRRRKRINGRNDEGETAEDGAGVSAEATVVREGQWSSVLSPSPMCTLYKVLGSRLWWVTREDSFNTLSVFHVRLTNCYVYNEAQWTTTRPHMMNVKRVVS